jgi:prephenate dehydratase
MMYMCLRAQIQPVYLRRTGIQNEGLMLRIGYLGPKGTFSHEALKKYIGNAPHTAVDFPSIPEILLAVQDGTVDEAIVPMENSIEGAINATLDMIVLEVDLLIKAELILPIREHLLVRKGTDIASVRYIMSHPQPLGQCRRFLTGQMPDVEIRAVYSTAAAAIEVANGNGDCAAIGSIAATEAYGLEIIKNDIQDNDNNHTRFVVIGSRDAERTGSDKTSLAFSTEDEPGSLYRILDIFNLWNINLSRIESRPAKNKLGRYIFFLDLIGHRDDQDLKDALTMVKRKTSFFKFLGSYPISSERD